MTENKTSPVNYTALDNTEYVPLKDHKYVVVSKMAYLLGIFEENFAEGKNFDKRVYAELSMNKNARIIRNLCILRTCIERSFRKIQEAMKQGRQDVFLISEYVPEDSVLSLSNDGIKLNGKNGQQPIDAIVHINSVISDRINNCRTLFPGWLKWEYVRNIFIMPNGTSRAGVTAAAKVYYENMEKYPYRVYVNVPSTIQGNMLWNDRRFVTQLYEWNGDQFTDIAKVMDVSDYIKSSIYDFIDNAGKIVMIVDCENSDVYNVISMLKSLKEDEHLEKVSSLILINDVHASTGWEQLSRYTSVPIEHLMTERVKSDKSIVDGTLIGKTYEEFYENNVDSFVLLSSDSDYWALIKMLKKANFIVMVEHPKCGPDLKAKLTSEGIFYCYLDDFYSGEETAQMKKDMLIRNLTAEVAERDFNIQEIFDKILAELRLEMSDSEKRQFYAEHLKNMKITIADDGTVQHNIKK